MAVSGGKDSLSLLWLLRERLRWIPKPYELIAVHLDMGFPGSRPAAVEAFCRSLGIPFHFEETDYGVRAHGPENRENPCFLCARLRRRHLFEMAHSLKCAKLAFGHNQDDIIETFFLNIFFGGQIGTMVPRQGLVQGGFDPDPAADPARGRGDQGVGQEAGLAGNYQSLPQRRTVLPGAAKKNADRSLHPQPKDQRQYL